MIELKKNDLIKARTLCNIFRYLENTDKHEARFFGLKIERFILASMIKDTHFFFLLSECQKSQVIYHLV